MTDTLEKLKEAIIAAQNQTPQQLARQEGFFTRWLPNPAYVALASTPATLDTLIAQQEKDKTSWTCPDCCVNPCECEIAPAQQQSASSLVDELKAAIVNPPRNEFHRGWNSAIKFASALIRQHTREPDVEAGARAIADYHNERQRDYCFGRPGMMAHTAKEHMGEAKACYHAAGWPVKE